MQENKITFLGTAGDSFVAGKQIRSSGGFVINIGETQLHIDPGPGALIRALEHSINPRANTAVISTDNSFLSSNGLNSLIDSMTYGGLDKNGLLVGSESVINGTEKENPIVSRFHMSCVERIITLSSDQKLGIEDTEIHSFKTYGKDNTGIGLKILAPRFTLGYTSNTRYKKELLKDLRSCDILILNVPIPSKEKSDTDLSSDDASKIIEEIKPRLAILTHFGFKMIKQDPLAESRSIQRDTGIQVISAKDGFTINPGSYSANSNQARLNAFNKDDTEDKKEENIDQKNKDAEEKEETKGTDDSSDEEQKEDIEQKDDDKDIQEELKTTKNDNQ